MKIDIFMTTKELFEILKVLNIDNNSIKKVRQFTRENLQIIFKDGHKALFNIQKGKL